MITRILLPVFLCLITAMTAPARVADPLRNRLTDVHFESKAPFLPVVPAAHGVQSTAFLITGNRALPATAPQSFNTTGFRQPEHHIEVANRLLIAGGICLFVGAGLLVGGIYLASNIHGDSSLGLFMAAGGALIGIAGFSMALTGGIIRLVDHARKSDGFYEE